MTTYGSREVWRGGVEPDPNPPRPVRMRTFAIERGHPLLRVWVSLRDAIEVALADSPVEWCGIEAYRRRPTIEPTDEDDATVMITGQRRAESDWLAAERTVLEICAAHGLAALRVELVDGAIDHYVAGGADVGSAIPLMGSSLSVRGLVWASGTFGGFVNLCAEGQPTVRCGITCHHVVQPTKSPGIGDGDLTAPSPLYDPSLEQVGVDHPAVASENQDLRIQQPSADELQKIRAAYITEMKSLDENITKCEGDLEMGLGSEIGLATVRRRRALYEELLAELDRNDPDFGHVFATSGYGVAEIGCALDWALVRVPNHRTGSNMHQVHSSLPILLRHNRIPTLLSMRAMAIGQEVVIFGKTTGASVGHFNEMAPKVRLPGQAGFTAEHVVTSAHGSVIARRGDSGALVLSEDRELLGMIIGGPTGQEEGQRAYVTPMYEICADVKARTGYSMELPDAA